MFPLAPFWLSGGMTDFPDDLQLQPNRGDAPQHGADNAVFQHDAYGEETLQQHFTDDVDTGDLFGGPGFDFSHDTSDDPFLLSGDQAPCRVEDFGNEPQQVQSSGAFDFGKTDTSPTLAREQHDALFARSLLSNCDYSGLKMPWEVGIFRDIFSDEPVPQPIVPVMEICADVSFGLVAEPQAIGERFA